MLLTILESAPLWLAIIFCLSQSAMFSGLNLAFFSLSRLRLEAESEQGHKAATTILNLRKDANLLLCTILWGNVSVNVLLAMLSESVLAGISAFLFSTIGITFFGEIIPQAYFSRNALRIGSMFAPAIIFYRVLLWPLAKPCSLILDAWIGKEGPNFYRERDLEVLLEKHIREEDSEIGATEGQGALNFLKLDDLKVSNEGCIISPDTIISLPKKLDLPIIPDWESEGGKKLLGDLKTNPRKRHIFTDEQDDPLLVLDTAEFLACYYSEKDAADIYHFCHRPIIVTTSSIMVDEVLCNFVISEEDGYTHNIDHDVVLYWTEAERRIITGSDIFRNLLKGIAREHQPEA